MSDDKNPKSQNEGHVLGIGGVFVRSADTKALIAWYQRVLGFGYDGYGCNFSVKDADTKDKDFQVWSPFKADTEYFGDKNKQFMINFRVKDLDALLEKIKAEGVELAGGPETHDEGKFAWIIDPEGTKLELWESPDARSNL